MSQFHVASRMLKESEGEKCPKCNQIWTDFMIIEPWLWACYQCGTVFVPKRIRIQEIAGKKEQILLQKKQKELLREVLNPLLCPEPDCGFIAKTEHGLKIHMKKHKKEA